MYMYTYVHVYVKTVKAVIALYSVIKNTVGELIYIYI